MAETTRRVVLEYVISVLELEQEDMKGLGIKSVTGLLNMNKDTIAQALSANAVSFATAGMLRTFLKWKFWQMETHGGLPSSLEEWKDAFTESSLIEADVSDQVKVTQKVIHRKVFGFHEDGEDNDDDLEEGEILEVKENGMKKRHMTGKIADYLSFNGKHENWYAFREEFEATAEMHGLTDVISLTSEKDHKLRMENDKV